MFLTTLIVFIATLYNFSETYFDYIINILFVGALWLISSFILAHFFTKRIKLVEKKK